MRKPSFGSWGKVGIDMPKSVCSNAWGHRIERAIFDDFSEEEQRSLASHVVTCEACAARLKEYQKIKEHTRKLSHYVVFKPSYSRKSLLEDYNKLRGFRGFENDRKEETSEDGSTAIQDVLVLMGCISVLIASLVVGGWGGTSLVDFVGGVVVALMASFLRACLKSAHLGKRHMASQADWTDFFKQALRVFNRR